MKIFSKNDILSLLLKYELDPFRDQKYHSISFSSLEGYLEGSSNLPFFSRYSVVNLFFDISYLKDFLQKNLKNKIDVSNNSPYYFTIYLLDDKILDKNDLIELNLPFCFLGKYASHAISSIYSIEIISLKKDNLKYFLSFPIYLLVENEYISSLSVRQESINIFVTDLEEINSELFSYTSFDSLIFKKNLFYLKLKDYTNINFENVYFSDYEFFSFYYYFFINMFSITRYGILSPLSILKSLNFFYENTNVTKNKYYDILSFLIFRHLSSYYPSMTNIDIENINSVLSSSFCRIFYRNLLLFDSEVV